MGKFPPWNILLVSYYPWFRNCWRLWITGPTCLQTLTGGAFWSRKPLVGAAYDQTQIHQKEQLSAPDQIRCSAMVLLSFPGLHKPCHTALRSWTPTRRYWWCHLHRSKIRRLPDPPRSQSTKSIFIQSKLELSSNNWPMLRDRRSLCVDAENYDATYSRICSQQDLETRVKSDNYNPSNQSINPTID